MHRTAYRAYQIQQTIIIKDSLFAARAALSGPVCNCRQPVGLGCIPYTRRLNENLLALFRALVSCILLVSIVWQKTPLSIMHKVMQIKPPEQALAHILR